MTDQLLSEFRKLRSTRTNLGLLAGMIALILVFLLTIGLTGTSSDLADHDHQHRLFSVGTQAALFATLIGVMAITSEFRHGTIRSTFVVTPHRGRVIAAKVVSSLLMASSSERSPSPCRSGSATRCSPRAASTSSSSETMCSCSCSARSR